ncbi:hypothetical protein GPECTOR_31g308 [Gonium pectorale]|uniref:Ankyrin repeat domain-containing protein n=1 Tax=Gonium pectorale TaxID=33097 RepID=A0A150GDN6_GONPE|nr:hypothetical protein GPECTOR_31g308 [Gonium pectorale]|eukprot:KXZ47946.1 hypothetical protein GPECTOR_31g308 [Gonium pectorale]
MGGAGERALSYCRLPNDYQELTTSFDITPSNASRVWIPDLVERIARHLPPNELPCTLRLVDKATAALFSGPHHTTVRLSQPVPHHFFARVWGKPSAMRSLTMSQRQQLLLRTAASGMTTNLEVLVSSAKHITVNSEAMEAAASAGHLPTCLRLRQAGCPWGDALQEAAGAGHLAVCEGLLAAGCPWSWGALVLAFRAGRLDVAEGLSKHLPHPPGFMVRSEELLAAAHGCDLAALQSFLDLWQALPVPRLSGLTLSFIGRRYLCLLIPTAAGSPTPDWQAKVEWLEGLGYQKTASACHAAAACPDAAARLAWLRGRGYPVDGGTAVRVCAAGDVAALRYLLAEGVRPTEEAATEAAAGGHLAALQALHAAGCPVSPLDVACAAAEGGHLAAVAWAVEAFGAAATLHTPLFASAALSGNVQMLAWLRERGCPWDEQAVTNAAEAGDGKALAWLAERGCPMPAQGEAYVRAARNGDLQTLACLRRLGCPWGSTGEVFGLCLDARCPLAALRWLAAEGCPVDWRVAAERARARWDRKAGEGAQVLAWLEEQRRLGQGCRAAGSEAPGRRRPWGRLLAVLGCGAAPLVK